MNNAIWNLLEPIAGEQTSNVMRWLDGLDGKIENNFGEMYDFNKPMPEHFSDVQRTDLAEFIFERFCKTSTYQPGKSQERSTPKAVPKPRTESTPDQPRRDYDDETLAGLVLDFLREHRTSEFTYNQVKDNLNVDWKQASRVLQNLVKRGDDVVRFDRKTAKNEKLKLYNHWC